MEKLLAMSILSSGPGVNGWLATSWATEKRSAGEENKGCSCSSSSSSSSSSQAVQGKKLQVPGKGQGRQRFALELDGLNCFETIVPY